MAITSIELKSNYKALLDETIVLLDRLKTDQKIGGDRYVELLALAIPPAMQNATTFTLDAESKECEIRKCNYTVDHILPAEKNSILMDIALKCSQKREIDYRIANLLPKEVDKLIAEIGRIGAETTLLGTQNSELILNGLKDRESKGIVDLLHTAQTNLYTRQKLSFDDKKQTDIVSRLLDVWTIEATNTIEANTGIGLVTKDLIEDKSELEVILDKYIDTETSLATELPAITITGANPMNLNVGDTYTELGATATDATDGDLTSSIVTTGTVDTAVADTYEITYRVTNSQGLTAKAIRAVIVT